MKDFIGMKNLTSFLCIQFQITILVALEFIGSNSRAK